MGLRGFTFTFTVTFTVNPDVILSCDKPLIYGYAGTSRNTITVTAHGVILWFMRDVITTSFTLPSMRPLRRTTTTTSTSFVMTVQTSIVIQGFMRDVNTTSFTLPSTRLLRRTTATTSTSFVMTVQTSVVIQGFYQRCLSSPHPSHCLSDTSLVRSYDTGPSKDLTP